MSAKHQFIKITIPQAYSPEERIAIGQKIIDQIIDRTETGIDKNGSKFPKYSDGYAKSLEFKVAGKSKSSVNLRLSGDMLAALKILDEGKGFVKIGYDRGSDENAKADGNIRGTYGSSSGSSSKARNFLGITKQERTEILSRFPIDDRRESLKEAKAINTSGDAAKEFIEDES